MEFLKDCINELLRYIDKVDPSESAFPKYGPMDKSPITYDILLNLVCESIAEAGDTDHNYDFLQCSKTAPYVLSQAGKFDLCTIDFFTCAVYNLHL